MSEKGFYERKNETLAGRVEKLHIAKAGRYLY